MVFSTQKGAIKSIQGVEKMKNLVTKKCGHLSRNSWEKGGVHDIYIYI